MRTDFDRAKNESLPWSTVLLRLGFRRLTLSKDEEDLVEAFDMSSEVRFALRVRKAYPDRPDYLEQFTIRWKRPNGVRTEKDKMLEGKDWPEYMGYGWHAAGSLDPWVLLRVAILRRLHQSGELEAAKVGDFLNHDKQQSTLRAFALPKLVCAYPDLVYTSSPSHPGIPAIQAPIPPRHPPAPRQLKLAMQ